MLEPELWWWAADVVASLDDDGRPTGQGRRAAPPSAGGTVVDVEDPTLVTPRPDLRVPLRFGAAQLGPVRLVRHQRADTD